MCTDYLAMLCQRTQYCSLQIDAKLVEINCPTGQVVNFPAFISDLIKITVVALRQLATDATFHFVPQRRLPQYVSQNSLHLNNIKTSTTKF